MFLANPYFGVKTHVSEVPKYEVMSFMIFQTTRPLSESFCLFGDNFQKWIIFMRTSF